MTATWPKAPIFWREDRTLYVSVPFTWTLPGVSAYLNRPNLLWDRAVVGGPAVRLMPDFLSGIAGVEIGGDMPGVLQRANHQATRTTTGCPRRCGFCGVRTIEPEYSELEDWPDLPILADNNLLAATRPHFDRVMDRLERHGWADFTQGLDSRLLDGHHAERLARLKDPRTRIRLALDGMNYSEEWEAAFERLRRYGVALAKIRSYALVGFNSGPDEAWERCKWVERHKIKVLPMWFHALDCMEANAVSERQASFGWTDYERRHIMQWFYQHKQAVAA